MRNLLVSYLFYFSLCSAQNVFAHMPTITEPDTTLAASYVTKAQLLSQKAKYDSANYFYEQASTIYEQAGDQSNARKMWQHYVSCFNNISSNLMEQGKYDKSIAYAKRAIAVAFSKIGNDYLGITDGYNLLGSVCFKKYDFDGALAYFNKSLTMKIRLLGENHSQVGYLYNNIGVIYRNQGDYETALSYYHKSLAIKHKELGADHPKLATTYNNIGNTYRHQGDYDKALEYLSKSLAIQIKAVGEHHPAVASIYNNIGETYAKKGELDLALDYHQKSLAIRLDLFGEQHPSIVYLYNGIGETYAFKNDAQTAFEYYHKAIEIGIQIWGDTHPDVAGSYQRLAVLYYRQKNYEQALSCTQKAIIALIPGFINNDIYVNPELTNSTSNKHLLEVLDTKATLFKATFFKKSQQLKDLEMALATYELALNLIDNMRNGYQAEGSKIFLGEELEKIVAEAIDVAIKLYEITQNETYKIQAFYLAEKAKSSILFASLLESKAKKFAGIPDSLLEHEKELKANLISNDTQLQQELQKKEKNSTTIRRLEAELFDLNSRHQKLIKQIEHDYPRYYQLKYQTTTANIAELQGLLDERSAIIDYFLSDSVIYIFTILQNDFDVMLVNIDSTFDKVADDLVASIKKLEAPIFLQASTQLYHLLIQPIADKIANRETLVIIPYGILLKIPFEVLISALPQKEEVIDFARLDYLIKHYDISYHYSGSLVFNCYNAKGKPISGAEETFIGFAPVFSDEVNNGYIIEGNLSAIQPADTESDVRSISLDGKHFNKLTYSEKEVQKIIKLCEKHHKQAFGYFHDQASEDNFKATAEAYKYVHIATHGIINEARPQLSGIVFSQPQESAATEDGILYAGETYNLELQADLVVISSCESGIGKLMHGEGLMALTRGFLYSGVSNIVVSLWKVSDKHTSQLMVDFYKNVFDGKSYARSLREAKLKMIFNQSTAFPKLWSGFIMVGR